MSKVETYEIQINDIYCCDCPQYPKYDIFCSLFKERPANPTIDPTHAGTRVNPCIALVRGKKGKIERYKIRISKIKSEVNHET